MKLILNFGLVLLMAGLMGCKNERPRLVLCAGGAPNEVEEWKAILKDFEAGHPGLAVDLQALPAESDLQLQAMGAALGSGKAPFDVMRLDVVWMADFVKRGWLEPLDSYLGAQDVSPFGALADETDRFDGQLMGLPWNVDVGLLYSRKDLLEKVGATKAPETFSEMLALAKKVKALPESEDLTGFLWQGKAYEGLSCNFLEAYARAGGSTATVEKTGQWEKKPAKAALLELQGLIKSALSPVNTATEMDEEGTRVLFQSGRAIFMRNWPYAAALAEADGSVIKGKVWVSPLPGAVASPGPGTLGGWQLAVRKGSPHAKEAAALIRYLTSSEIQVRLAHKLGWNPSRKDAYKFLMGDSAAPHLEAVERALTSAVNRPRMQGYPKFSEKAFQAVNQVLLGRISPDDAVRMMNAH